MWERGTPEPGWVSRTFSICRSSLCFSFITLFMGFPGGSDSKESACNARDQVRSLGQEDPLEKGMATYSSILAWRTPWTEEPGGLQSSGSQRVGHAWATNTHTHINSLFIRSVARQLYPSASQGRNDVSGRTPQLPPEVKILHLWTSSLSYFQFKNFREGFWLVCLGSGEHHKSINCGQDSRLGFSGKYQPLI